MLKNKCNTLFAILAVGLVTGSTQAKDRLVLWHSFQEQTVARHLEILLTKFGEDHRITVEAREFQNSDIKPSLISAAQEDKLPDVFIAAGDFAGLYQTLDLSPIPLKTIEPFDETIKIGANYYGAPFLGGNHLVLYYNKEFVKTPISDFNEIASQKEAFRARGIGTIGWQYREPFWLLSFLSAYGVWPVTEQGKPNLSGPRMEEALRAYYELGSVIARDCTYQCGHKDFIDGKFAYSVNGVWAFAEFQKKFGPNFGVSPLPTFNGKSLNAMYSTISLFFPKQALSGPKSNTLIQLARYFRAPRTQESWIKHGLIPAVGSSFNKLKRSASQQKKMVLKQLEVSKPMPNLPSMVYIWEALRKGWLRYEALRTREKPMPEKTASEFMQKLAIEAMEQERLTH
ncbi:sugar ABC transporter substrate-binding protein [Pseudobacteriovorax antillogorgiicola]|uniref:Carbohydrate ABC transporter substrate-binding protein, CUT1 family n=1 Tax=Pseudobacteriovorax antillogorgiicola TaxID=1513793 RepID=A0A1Y6BB67_9BACT|nr:extracellular solute-binding protein [Pseudobacteriovorax antillogorgiicola]TCS57335.1 carbohydrate ABC transporter substrate-binding protein (CUT1 family) [Pseudobacteriovorax antillogorgiicola]SMF02366.1 carbohydrate ABC transporter substrate-binding protein, CUT1 family [Pseudobacteriovorax antillogorgiicola]